MGHTSMKLAVLVLAIFLLALVNTKKTKNHYLVKTGNKQRGLGKTSKRKGGLSALNPESAPDAPYCYHDETFACGPGIKCGNECYVWPPADADLKDRYNKCCIGFGSKHDMNFCSRSNQCYENQGDCDSDSDCRPGLPKEGDPCETNDDCSQEYVSDGGWECKNKK